MPNKARSLTPCLTRGRGRPTRDAMAMPREEILRQAFAAFARDGYDGVSLRNLAAACGISDSLLTHHFGNKPQLWREACDSVFEPLMARLTALLDAIAASQQHDAVLVLQSNLPQALKLVAADPLALQFLFREGEGDDERGDYIRTKFLQPYLQRIDALFEQAQRAGVYRPVSAGSRHALVMGLLRSVVMPGLLRQELAPHLATGETISRYIDDAVSVLYRGLILDPDETSATPATGPSP